VNQSTETLQRSPGAQFQILLMEDEDSVARGLQMILQEEGYGVDVAVTGQSALDTLDHKAFDLLVADLRLPDMNGLEVVKRMKKDHPQTDAIVITGFANVASAVEAMQNGAVDYLPKPFTEAEFTERVQAALRQRRTAVAAAIDETVAAGPAEARPQDRLAAVADGRVRLPHVLLMEDEDSVARALQTVLRENGFGVDWVATGQKAIDAIADNGFDLLVADLQLPDMNGMEVIRQVKDQKPATQVIAISGYASIPSVADAIRAGVADYLPKPFTEDELVETVQKAWHSRQHTGRQTTERGLPQAMPAREAAPNAARILLMEDEVSVAQGLQMILNEEGYRVEVAMTGQGALDRLGSEGFDLLIADLRLPDIDGMEVVRQVRAKRPQTAIIIMTGYATVSSAVESLRIGAVDYLPKPFTDEELTSTVDRALEQQDPGHLRENLEPVESEVANLVRVGFYLCNCDVNLPQKMRLPEIVAFVGQQPNVVLAKESGRLCHTDGLAAMASEIQDRRLNHVVVACCNPQQHDAAFRQTCRQAGLHPNHFQMISLREQVSWVTEDEGEATRKAKILAMAAVRRAHHHHTLTPRRVDVQPDILVVGGGIAGMQAALDIADAGHKAYLVERAPTIGGHMLQFDKTFPTLDCAACIGTPKMVSVALHPNIELMTYSEVAEVAGGVGNYRVAIREKPRYVDLKRCTGCGQCIEACPVGYTFGPSRAEDPASNSPLPGRLQFEIDPQKCKGCHLCVRHCPVQAVSGEKKEPHRIDQDRCIQCGACYGACKFDAIALVCRAEDGQVPPERRDGTKPPEWTPRPIPSEWEAGIASRKAIYIPFPQAMPLAPTIDPETCAHLRTGKCGLCSSVCEAGAIDFDQKARIVDITVGSIIVATGYDQFDPTPMKQFGYGRYPNVLTSLEFERLNNATGPTGGKILLKNSRGAFDQAPRSVAIIHCVGSRDENYHRYCSRVCCMYALKYGHLIREKVGPQAMIYDFYVDMRCFGKGYEEFFRRCQEEGVLFIRGKPAEITDRASCAAEQDKLIVIGEDTLLGSLYRIPVDMVILCAAMEARRDTADMARLLHIQQGEDGFFQEAHAKLAPLHTNMGGIFLAGTCQGPKDIPDTVAQASGAAARALELAVRGRVEIPAAISWIDPSICRGCQTCVQSCPQEAIRFDRRQAAAVVNQALCRGCGACVRNCPSGAAQLWQYGSRRISTEGDMLPEALQVMP